MNNRNNSKNNSKLTVLFFICIFILVVVACCLLNSIQCDDLIKKFYCYFRKDHQIFSWILSLEGIAIAVIVFVLSKYGQILCGLSTEDILCSGLGKKYLEWFRVFLILFPVIGLVLDIFNFNCILLTCFVFMFSIMSHLIWHIIGLMSKEKALVQLEKMISDERKHNKEQFKYIVPIETARGYLDLQDQCWKSDTEVFEMCSSNLMLNAFSSENSREELYLVSNSIYKTILEKDSTCFEIDFLYTYRLTVEMLAVSDRNNCFDWKFGLLDNMMIKYGRENYGGKVGLIFGILTSNNINSESFLIEKCIKMCKLEDDELAGQMFSVILGLVELLYTVYNSCYKIMIYLQEHANLFKYKFCEKYNDFYNISVERFAFIISITGICSETEVTLCFNNVNEDLKNIFNKEYIPISMVGYMLKGIGNC